MGKLKKKGASTSITAIRSKETKSAAITTVKRKLSTSYQVSPLSLRMSVSDKAEINNWVEELQEMTERKVSAAKLFRALTLIRKDIEDDLLISMINKMN